MITQPAWQIWAMILCLGAGTFAIRWSALGFLGNRQLPVWAERALRYTAVGVLPALVAPGVFWPEATGGQPDAARLAAAAATLAAGMITRSVLVAVLAGGFTLYGVMWMT